MASLLNVTKVAAGLNEGLRLSRRSFDELRELIIRLYPRSSWVELGRTVVLARIQASQVMPWPDRPNEGMLSFSCHYGRSTTTTVGHRSPKGDHIAQVVDSVIKGSNAIDMNSLCILSGQRVWNLKVHIHVVVDDGNVLDAACMSCMAALSSFRFVDATAAGDHAESLANADDPLPLLHHPLTISFAVVPYQSKKFVVADPDKGEESASAAIITIGCNPAGDICLVNKCGGTSVTPETISQ
ncbi:3' exoribonuclease domain protein [Gregarina niphandrodes]|uniref:3' exoribonuclease domain protein n=1 Tax=Gregarina niphandrodes TaxID=110365 RepID=A0A023BDK2_GRENI|nr:3' exoribonuclease domain protein [Gregarina niphandrodes]EZG89047.1 3' exoribonuclease domain protein [Gregarina niphandrodes]|eukprot:XP_011128516.1 3' exoribonuclease domain protein [Gregarina niphandrodes]